MNNSIILENVSRDELRSLITEVVSTYLENNQNKPVEQYLTRTQVAEMFHISLPSVHSYTKSGKLKGYRLSGRVLYKQSEIESALQKIRS